MFSGQLHQHYGLEQTLQEPKYTNTLLCVNLFDNHQEIVQNSVYELYLVEDVVHHRHGLLLGPGRGGRQGLRRATICLRLLLLVPGGAAERTAGRRVLPARWLPAHELGVPAQGAHLGASLSPSPPVTTVITTTMTIITTTTTPLTSLSSCDSVGGGLLATGLVPH